MTAPKIKPGLQPEKRLQEKDFIQDSLASNPLPFWLWLVLLVLIASLFWGGSSWVNQRVNREVAASPFLQVTNRQFSLFLWQFPNFMRINSRIKTGYLPGFQDNNVSINLEDSDKYVVAPPETLFMYHTWSRLIAHEYAERPILAPEFQEFLSSTEEWQPKNWREAPREYAETVAKLSLPDSPKDLQSLPHTALPVIVRQAFQGWKNYFKEGDAINAIKPTYDEMARFLKLYPHYARPNWRNIMMDKAPSYLIKNEPRDENAEIPADQLAPFLKVAFYNYQQSIKNL